MFIVRFFKTLAILAIVTEIASAENTYTSANGAREVIVYTVPFEGTESNVSNTKCIEYTKEPPKDYSKGCVSTIYNVNDKIFNCAVDFDDTDCNSCEVCETPDSPPVRGFKVVCNNILPEKNIQSTCKPFDDELIQEYLLSPGHFDGQTFDFDSEAPGSENTGGDDNTTSGVDLIFSAFASLAFVVMGALPAW